MYIHIFQKIDEVMTHRLKDSTARSWPYNVSLQKLGSKERKKDRSLTAHRNVFLSLAHVRAFFCLMTISQILGLSSLPLVQFVRAELFENYPSCKYTCIHSGYNCAYLQ